MSKIFFALRNLLKMAFFLKKSNHLKINNPSNSIGIVNNNINIKPTKFERIRKKTKEILLTSTVHGIPNIIRSENILMKIIWLLFILLFTISGSWNITKIIVGYTKYSPITTISIVDEHESEFPAISFCFYPPLVGNMSFDETFIKFDKINLTDNKSYYFQEYEDPIYNKCFRINSGKSLNSNKAVEILKSSMEGQTNGLKLEMNIYGIPKEMDFFELIVNVHNRSTPPFDISNGGFWIKPGIFFQIIFILLTKISIIIILKIRFLEFF
jgi:hypothetical protein